MTSKMRLEWQREPLKILEWIPSREELWESVPENWKSEIPGLSGNGLIACFICHFDTTWDHLGENSTEELSRSGFPEGGCLHCSLMQEDHTTVGRTVP